MSIKISEMTLDTSIGGAEMIPVSDAGAAKRTTPAALAAYTVDQIEAITAGVAVTGADSVFVLQGGVLKPVDIDVVCQYGIDAMWGKTAETTPGDTDVMLLKDGGVTEKTVTLAYLASYFQSAIAANILNVSTLGAAAALGSGDLFLVTQGTTGKKVAFSAISTAIYGSLAAYVTAATAVSATNNADVFYCLQGGVERKVTLSQIIAHAGSPVTGTGTTDLLAQWSATSTLKAGPAIIASTSGFGVGLDTELPTTKAVRAEMDTIIADSAAKAAPVAADRILIGDSADSYAQKRTTIGSFTTAISVSGVNNADGTGTFTIQVTNGSGVAVAGARRVTAWISDGNHGMPHFPATVTGVAAPAGGGAGVVIQVLADQFVDVVTDTNGTATLDVTVSGNFTAWLTVQIGDAIASASVAITMA